MVLKQNTDVRPTHYRFENDVKMYGTETYKLGEKTRVCLRMM